jgi:15-cis-phytoene synthase
VPLSSSDAPATWETGIVPLPQWLVALAEKPGSTDPLAYLAEHSRSFRFAARFLPRQEAGPIAEVYAFCRFTDDLVDRAPASSQGELEARLDQWESLVRLAHSGAPTGLPILDRSIGRMGSLGIPVVYAIDLIGGMRMDVRPRQFESMADLETYTYRVAGVVGKWLTEMSGVRNPWVLARAADLGHAMQITNIVRDVGEDWARGRLYLPLDAMNRHGLDPRDLERASEWKGVPPQNYRNLMEELMQGAEKRYRAALDGIPSLPGYFRRSVLVAAFAYQRIHTVLRRNGYDNFGKRAFSSPWDKFRVGVKALWYLRGIRVLPPGNTLFRRQPRFSQLESQSSRPDPHRPRREPDPPVHPGLAGFLRGGAALTLALLAATAGLPAHAGEESRPGRQSHAENVEDAPPERPNVFRKGLEDLRIIEARIAAHPDSLSPRLDHLRVLFVLGVKRKTYLESADAELLRMEKMVQGDPEGAGLLMAYRGAVRVVRAKHGFNPNRKMENLKAGLPLLDSAVAAFPEQAEVRYLRLVSGYYLPFFIGRKPQVNEDFAALAKLLPVKAREYPPKWFLSVSGFVLAKGNLGEAQRTALETRMAEVTAAEPGKEMK